MGVRVLNRRQFHYYPNPSTVGEVGKSLSADQKRLVLESMRDVYKDARLDKEEKGIDYRGEMIWGYPYSPDLFKTSSVTGRAIRYYITLPDGRIAHPTEVYPNLRQSEVDRELQRREYEEKQEQQRIADKLMRVVPLTDPDPMQEANIRYHKTRRPREGSYFAYDGKGRIVRVDGNDSKDVRFWEEQGFFKR